MFCLPSLQATILKKEASVFFACCRDSDAVKSLADLLCCHHVQCQVCAAGALMNVLGPEISSFPHSKQRRAFSKLVSQCLTLGIIYNAILDPSSTKGLEVV